MDNINNLKHICYGIPKAEMHCHIEGTLEPELVIKLAHKHKITQYGTLEELRSKYQFTCLRDFLELYYSCCNILIDEEDFEELTYDYLKKASSQGLKYAEIFFDPQSHLNRGVSFETVINGLHKGLNKAKSEFNVNAQFILCFLRDLSEDEALTVLNTALPHKNKYLAIGLDSNEFENPPEKFKNVYALAKENGLRLVAHAGEECSIPTEYIYQALDILKVERIDHGVQAIKCEKLVERLVNEKIPLTVCPLSNIKLKVFDDLAKSPIKQYLDKGVLASINSDDPAYFGGYIGDNYYETSIAFKLELSDIVKFAKISFISTFLDEKEKENYLNEVDKFVKELQ